MGRKSFTSRVRGALKLLNRPEGVTNVRLAEALDLLNDAQKRPMYRCLRDMVRSGEVARLSPGVHFYVGRPDPLDKQRVMWRALRALRQSGQAASVDDMMEMAGVSRNYAKEFLQRLAQREIVRRVGPSRKPGKYVLVKDLVKFPADEEKADRLRILREKKKAAKAALIKAQNAISAAYSAVDALEDEE